VDDFFDQVDPARLAAVRYERDRIDKWIRDHLVVNPNVVGCQRCRRPIIAGDRWTETSNGETRGRYHRLATMRGVLSGKRRRGRR
jgi:hypothetical protein